MHDPLARPSEASRAWRWPPVCLALLVLAAPALAQAADPPTAAVQGLAGQLPAIGLSAATTTVLTLFLIAVLLESALALVFTWRPFIETFNARATRPLVAFLAAWIFVGAFHYDAVTGLMQAMTNVTIPPGPLGPLLTAAILAGGSAGVNNLLVTLGFRQVRTPATETPKVPPHLAWIALHVSRAGGAKGDVKAWIGEADANDPAPCAKLPLAGVISPVGMRGVSGCAASSSGTPTASPPSAATRCRSTSAAASSSPRPLPMGRRRQPPRSSSRPAPGRSSTST